MLAWGFTQEPPNEILILANDLERLSPGETILGADSVLEARIAAAEKKLAADTAAKRR